jgi:hypothetical protein
MATVGFQVWGEQGNASNERYDTYCATTTTFSVGDTLGISSGKLVLGVASSGVLVGVCAKAQASTSTATTVLPYIPITDTTIFFATTNLDLTGDGTDGGTYYAVSGTTGAQVVDVSSNTTTTTARQIEIVKVDPNGKGGSGSGSGLRECLVRIIKTSYSNITAT